MSFTRRNVSIQINNVFGFNGEFSGLFEAIGYSGLFESTLVYQLHFRENVETGFLCVVAVGTGTISKKPYSVKWTLSRRIHANYLGGDSS